MKKITLILLSCIMAGSLLAQHSRLDRFEKVAVRPFDMGKNIGYEAPSTQAPVQPLTVPGNRSLQKVSMSSSLNANGIFSYEERYVTIDKTSNLFCFGNRAGGPFGNTGNDLKFTFSNNQGASWDSVVYEVANGRNYRYPGLIVFNPSNSSTPGELYSIISGPIYESSWTRQYFGSKRLDGQYEDVNFVSNESTVYLNHLNIDLYCSPDGHATVASFRLNGNSSTYTYHGWEVLNGTFNPADHKFDWQVPLVKVEPLLKEEGRVDASRIAWSVDGSTGYLFGTAVDSNTTWNPYGVEWPVIYKTTDHGVTWNKMPAFDFSTIPVFRDYLYPTRADTTKIIPRWYNKWASNQNQGENGATVDMYGNLHIFGLVRSTMSINPDSLNYFYTAEPQYLFDVYMKNGGGWDAVYVDSLITTDTPDPGTYGISWDHQTQMTRSADGSKVFCVWTDTDPMFGTENTNPDVKGFGFDVLTGMATPVKNFTGYTVYWGINMWMRVANQVFYDEASHTSTLPITTSTPGQTNEDPLTHEYMTGADIADNEFSILVGQKEITPKTAFSPVSANYPNPFREATTILVKLDKPAQVTVQVSTITGEKISTVDRGILPAGKNTVKINGSGLPVGIYFYTILIDGTPYSGKMMVR